MDNEAHKGELKEVSNVERKWEGSGERGEGYGGQGEATERERRGQDGEGRMGRMEGGGEEMISRRPGSIPVAKDINVTLPRSYPQKHLNTIPQTSPQLPPPSPLIPTFDTSSAIYVQQSQHVLAQPFTFIDLKPPIVPFPLQQ